HVQYRNLPERILTEGTRNLQVDVRPRAQAHPARGLQPPSDLQPDLGDRPGELWTLNVLNLISGNERGNGRRAGKILLFILELLLARQQEGDAVVGADQGVQHKTQTHRPGLGTQICDLVDY